MNGNELANIPVLYTGIAEILTSLIYILALRKKISTFQVIILTIAMGMIQVLFGEVSDLLLWWMWPSYMLLRLTVMFIYLYLSLDKEKSAIIFFTLKAFMIAEFIASFEWQAAVYYEWNRMDSYVAELLMAIIVYLMLCAVFFMIEKKWSKESMTRVISIQEILMAACIAVLIFLLSNISFFNLNTIFSGSGLFDMFNMRTIFDLLGVVSLLALQSRMNEIEMRVDVEKMDRALRLQYIKYQNYQDHIELINMKYHDLKHQLEDLKRQGAGKNQELLIDNIESELTEYSPSIETGNQVLDALLDSRQALCRRRQIVITAVADGKLLDFMHVADICAIFGNALDNAIESVVTAEDVTKRLIHLEVTMKKQFVAILIENTCEMPVQIVDGMPKTRHKDKTDHGYGTRSICHTVQKYGGSTLFSAKDQWFTLQILIPLKK